MATSGAAGSKLERALSLGVPVIDLARLLEMISPKDKQEIGGEVQVRQEIGGDLPGPLMV